jgi:hypothetical protein
MATEPRSPARPWWAGGWALALGSAFLASNLWHRVGYFDEGYALYGAWRIRAGAWPYRDFLCSYGPGSFCANAAAMALLGQRVMAVRLLDLCVRLGIAWSCGWAAWRAGAGRYAGLALGAALFLLGGLEFFGYAGHLGLLLALFCSLAWCRSLAQEGRAWAVAAGALAGTAGFVRQDFGAYLAAAMVLHSLAASLVQGGSKAWRRLAWALAAAVAVGGALYAPFAALAGPATLWHELVARNLGLMDSLYNLPPPGWAALGLSLRGLGHGDWTAFDPGQAWMALYLGGAVLLDLLLVSLWRARRGGAFALEGLWFALLGGLLLRQGLNRADLIHLFPSLLMALVGAGIQAGAWGQRRSRVAWLLLGLYFIAAPLSAWGRYLSRLPSLPSSNLERAAGLPLPPDLDAAVAMVRQGTRPGDCIYVANAAAEQGLVNHVLFYFLADRPCAVYDELVLRPMPPGNEQEIADGLARPDLGAVVLWNGLGTGLGSSDLDRRLQSFGTGPVYGSGDYELRFRRPVEAPKKPS